MKSKFIKIAIILFVVFCIWFVFMSLNYKTTPEYIEKQIKADISFCDIIKDKNTHGGFLGDGDYIVIADCKKSQAIILEQIQNWNRLPLTENLQLLMYGGEKDGTSYSSKLAEEIGISDIEKGYYYFLDRNDEAIYYNSDEDLLSRFSYNCTIAIYDEEANIFYYYELDT